MVGLLIECAKSIKIGRLRSDSKVYLLSLIKLKCVVNKLEIFRKSVMSTYDNNIFLLAKKVEMPGYHRASHVQLL